MAQRLNNFIFVKNGYSPLKHLIPFAFAALLLLTLSVPAENLLLKLANLLSQPRWVWLPAVMLTLIALIVYVLTVRVQVRKAHLWSDRDRRLTITTSVLYLVLCTSMAFVVLQSATIESVGQDFTIGNVWTCLLVAVLSLTGVGWSSPGTWVELIGVKVPDYEDGRPAVQRATKILNHVRDDRDREDPKQYAVDFSKAVQALHSSIESNLDKEPSWAKPALRQVSGAASALAEETKAFLKNEDLVTFKAACRCQEVGFHEAFVEALEILGKYWGGFKCPEKKLR